MTNQDLKRLLKKVQQLRDQGLSFEKMAKTLNESGFTNLEGEKWKRGAVERFYKRRVQAVEGEMQREAAASMPAAPSSVSQEKPVPSQTSEVLPDALDLVLKDLKEVLRWWKTRQAEVSPEEPPALPELLGPGKTRRVTINEGLLSLAEARIGKEQVSATDLSGLIELALRRYLGCPIRDEVGATTVAEPGRKRGRKEGKK